MKKLIILSVFTFSFFAFKAADAQLSISLNIHTGSQPEWGPAGYTSADYYYLPDIDVYYHIADRMYTYYEGNRWLTGAVLPARYSHYNLYKGYKVVINGVHPWTNYQYNRTKYAPFRGHRQENIRDFRRKYAGSQHHAVRPQRMIHEQGNSHRPGREDGHYANNRPEREHDKHGRF